MENNEIFAKLKNIIIEFVDIAPEDITPETNVRTDLGLNSLELVNLAVAIEEAFDTEIPDRAAMGLETLADAVEIIKTYAE